jgi:hypothetical protein
MKIASLEHAQNMLCTQIVFCLWFDIQNNLCTQHGACSELAIFMYYGRVDWYPAGAATAVQPAYPT